MPYDNSARVDVPAMYMGDVPISIHIQQVDVTDDYRAEFAYVVTEGTGSAKRVALQGRDLCGPATGLWPEAADMAVTLANFLGATYECGEVSEHGESYSAADLAWLEIHSERLGSWAAEMEESGADMEQMRSE